MFSFKSISYTIVAAAFAALGAAAHSQDASQAVGGFKFSAGEILWLKSRITLSGGRPRIVSTDGRLDITADSVVVELNPKAKSQKEQVSQVKASGSVAVRVATPERTASVDCETAVYTASSDSVVFQGGVSALITDAQLQEPGQVKAAKITYWLSPADDAPRLRIEGSPARVNVTPKARPKPEGKGQ